MDSLLPSQVSSLEETMEDEKDAVLVTDEMPKKNKIKSPLTWLKILSKGTHWSFVFGVIVIYGVMQGLVNGTQSVAIDYYWKDVQMVQPSAAQVYQGIAYIPWVVKPVWGLLTDVLPMFGYRRKPYIIFAGVLGLVSMLTLSIHGRLHVAFALLAITAGNASLAIADATIDACIAQYSVAIPSLAADIQSLCGLSSSIGALLGFSISGLLIRSMGSQGTLGLLSIPTSLLFLAGMFIKELSTPGFAFTEVHKRFLQAGQTMWSTLKCPQVWRPCLYIYVSLSFSLDIQEGMFFWYTHPKAGPSFSQEAIGYILSIGSVGSLLGVLLYQNLLKDFSFWGLLFWAQLLTSCAGMLDLVLVLRLNIKLGMPDYFFVVIDKCVAEMIGQIKWLPLLVLSSKLCPRGIEGTFFAVVMAIENVGMFSASWGGGLLLHGLRVTRSEFSHLWEAILIRNIMRVLPLALLFLVPRSNQDSTILPPEMLVENIDMKKMGEVDVELSLVNNTNMPSEGL